MAYDQLQLYNDALDICEERQLANLNENRKPRRLLDGVWKDNQGVYACLEEGDWTFATRTAEANYDPAIQPAFGYQHAFQKPADWARTVALSLDPYFTTPCNQYVDENNYWWLDFETLFVKWVSKDAQYGLNLALWPGHFKDLVAAYFAKKIIGSLSRDRDLRTAIEKLYSDRLTNARSKDSMNRPTMFLPRGTWSRARRGTTLGRPERAGQSNY